MGSILNRLIHARALRRWRRAAHSAADVALPVLRQDRSEARELRAQLDRLIHVADGRLALPKIGTSYFPKPHGTDWSWRPALWRGPLPRPGISSVQPKTRIGTEISVFHDCGTAEITLRQIRNTRESDLAAFGLRMDVFNFDGTFLSLVIDLPPEAVRGMTRDQLLRLSCIIEAERPLEIFARLNIKHGPNTEQLVREMPMEQSEAMIEFDLAYTKLNEKRIESAWLDLIFEAPEMNQVTLRDLTLARHPRAAL